MSPLLPACFAISGAAALALEMLWMRSAGLAFGHTAGTTAAVLAAYFTGLTCGAATARGIRRRPARTYGLLEIGAAAGALWSVIVFRLLMTDGARAWSATLGWPGQLAAIAAAVLPATLCFGATLPAIGQTLAHCSFAARASALYALNTLGGAAGIAAASFGLPVLLGVSGSYAAVASASALAGAVAIAVSSSAPAVRDRGVSESASETSLPRGRLRAVAAGAGAVALALEVLWTRLFAQVLHNSVYSFGAVTLVFVLALAFGAAAAAIALRRHSPAGIAAGALVAAGVATTTGLWIFFWWTDGLAYFGMRSGLAEYVLRIVFLAAATVGPGALASGMVLPALWALWGNDDGAARPLGDLSAANTLGGIVGALGAAFGGVPLIGLRGCFLVAAVAYVMLADIVASRETRLRPLAYAALLVFVIFDPARMPLVHLRAAGETLLGVAEGPNGIASVVDVDGDRQLRLDNYYVLGGSAAAANQRRLGLVPLLVHPHPRRVAFIGLATGITASAGPALGVEETTIFEVVPEVADVARTYFSVWNGDVLGRPGVRLVLDDARTALAATPERFDVIVADLFIPWHAGASSLYAREMYQTVARRLASGGVFCQWLPLYQLTRDEFDVIAQTFLAVFPHASVWRDDFYPNRPVLGLIAQSGARGIDLERVRDRLAKLPDWSRDPLLATPSGLVMLYAGDLVAGRDAVRPAPINTDDRPRIEFMAPRLTRMNASGDKDWFAGEALADWYDDLDRRLAGHPDPLFPTSPEVVAARQAGSRLYRYALAASRGDRASANRYENEVRDLVPDVVASADSASAITGVPAQVLGGLRAEQETMRQQLDAMQRRLSELTRAEGEPQ